MLLCLLVLIKICLAYSGLSVSTRETIGDGEVHAEAVCAAWWLGTDTRSAARPNGLLKYRQA